MSAVARNHKVRDNVTIEDSTMMFRNFSGNATQYNQEGNRNFCLLLDPPSAKMMGELGWPVKQLKVNEEYDNGEAPQDFIRVKVSYRGRPPRVVLVTKRGKTALEEQDIDVLDMADVQYVEATLNPYNYEVNGNRGVSAYLKSLYVFLKEDYLDEKYAHIPYVGETPDHMAIEAGDYIEAEVVEDEDGDEVALLEIGS